MGLENITELANVRTEEAANQLLKQGWVFIDYSVVKTRMMVDKREIGGRGYLDGVTDIGYREELKHFYLLGKPRED